MMPPPSGLVDFSRVDNDRFKLADLQREYTRERLIVATNASIDYTRALIQDADDTFVQFQPHDPDAHDSAASDESETNMAWTLGHVIVHLTASGEETAAIGATLARGVPVTWRNRYEVPWQHVQTVQHLSDRLEESRRIRLAYLDAWPDTPHLDVTFDKIAQYTGHMNAIGYVLFGLKHDDDHFGQIAEIMQQATNTLGVG